MANPYAGEVDLRVNGSVYTMKLTLGVLAELETAMEADSLIALVERFEAGRYRARDVLFLLRAGLRGGGADISLNDLAEAEFEGGPVVAARAAAALLARAFALPQDAQA